ncbi:MAG: hypothetical protein ACF8OB_12945 [Phycisphaeraceae bacterium JB051]
MKWLLYCTIPVILVMLTTCQAQAAEVIEPIAAQDWANYLARSAKVLGAGLSVGFTARFFIQFTAFQLRSLRMLARRS